MAAGNNTPATGLLNLEKELICFICTEILHQPLTLIDCLHTFCGSCLKEWFSHQHRKASHSHTPDPNPYTCPTCRATVKDAQHNAMINTLLDMFLVANPERRRSADEMAEMAQVYKPGDQILPKVENRRRERRRREEEELARRERRLVDEARERSLRDIAQSGISNEDRLSPHQTEGRSRSRDHDERRERRIQEREERRQRRERVEAAENAFRDDQNAERRHSSPPPSSPRHPDAVEARSRARTVAHQASLRSLVSASDSGTGTGDSLDEAAVMQEILAEGLLDGIDVDNLSEVEQDELSELIAERYRQLHPRRSQRSGSSQDTEHAPVQLSPNMANLQLEEADRQPRHASRTERNRDDVSPRSVASAASRQDRPPTAYPQSAENDQTLSPPASTKAHRRRASDQSGRPDSARQHRSTHPGASRQNATRSATDLSEQPESASNTRLRRLSSDQRSHTEPQRSPKASEVWRQRGVDPAISIEPQVDSPTHLSRSSTDAVGAPATDAPRSVPQIGPSEADGSALAVQTQFEEPSISCYRCNRPSIQYEVFKHCSACDVDLCLRCYRSGRGCNHWFGFGHAAMARFEASHPQRRTSRAIALPHVLVGRQYLKPVSESVKQPNTGTHAITSTSDPASRLQEGHFCDRCGSFANACFWTCDYCNDGEWGFCNNCVNTHHCCSHPLLPIAHKHFAPTSSMTCQPGYDPSAASMNLKPNDIPANIIRSSPAHSAASSATSTTDYTSGPRPDFVNLTITVHCDICRSPIQPTSARYHCPSHPTPTPSSPASIGDYDLCTSCYHNLVKTGRVKRDDGPAGWRKCPAGHRMIITAFEHDDDAGGQRRVILHDLIGGIKMTSEDVDAWQTALDSDKTPPTATSRGQWTWRDPAESSETNARQNRARAATLTAADSGSAKGKARFPPEGGLGRICIAGWSYYPEDGEEGKGELMFPKNADVSEVVDINEDWCEAVYAGQVGLVFKVYIRELES